MPSSSAEQIIEPRRGLLAIDWGSVWQYRELVGLFARLEYTAKVKQTLLGPLWFALSPLLTAVVFFGVFAGAMGVPTDGIPPVLFYLCGLLAWNYFSQSTSGVSTFLTQHGHVFRKVYVPKLVFPLSVVVAKLVPFAFQFLVFVAGLFYVGASSSSGDTYRPGWGMLVLPFLVAQMAALSIGVGLCLAALSVRFRDLQQVTGLLLQLWLYGTPVIYPASAVPAPWHAWLKWNPMTSIVEGFRSAFFGTAWDVTGLTRSLALTAILVMAGLLLFHRIEDTVVDRL